MNVGGITHKIAKLHKISVLRQPAHSPKKKRPDLSTEAPSIIN